MFIYNVKLNGSKVFKILIISIIIIAILLCAFVIFKLFKETVTVKDENHTSEVNYLTNQNYATVLETVHNDIDSYIGQKIHFSGFIYRVYDLNNEQFVLGRHMIISSDFQSVVVGFLCHYKDASSFKDNTWVEIEGSITKGEYHGNMPILEVTSIKQIDKPNDEYVYPPNENYIPTSSII